MTTATRSQILDIIAEIPTTKSDTGARFDADIAADAILNGEVTPDDNDGTITDVTEALVFGALMSDGRWWVASKTAMPAPASLAMLAHP